MSYNTSGKLKLTVVVGNAYTGRYAIDGSFNAVQTSENTTIKQANHPCGALWVTTAVTPSNYYAVDGTINSVSDGGGGFVLAFP